MTDQRVEVFGLVRQIIMEEVRVWIGSVPFCALKQRGHLTRSDRMAQSLSR